MVTLVFEGFEKVLADLRNSGAEVLVVGIDPIPHADTATDLDRKTFLAQSPILLTPLDVAAFDGQHAVVSSHSPRQCVKEARNSSYPRSQHRTLPGFT